MNDSKQMKQLRVLKLSKDKQKRVLGGETRNTECDENSNEIDCVGAFHRVVDNYYKKL